MRQALNDAEEYSVAMMKLKEIGKEVTDEEIDAVIEKYSIGWKISRISKVALAVLRLAVCEMMFIDDVPTGVSINEAVELCKKYAANAEPAFVNGILGTVAKEVK